MGEETSLHIRIVTEPIKTLKQTPAVLQFAESSPNDMKFIVVNQIFAQPFKQLVRFKGVEVFWAFELVNDLFSNSLIPRVRLLSAQEVQGVLSEYNVRIKELSKIDKTDFLVRYMGFKIGSVLEIHRPSITSGVAVGYRVVVDCHWDKLFQT